LEGQDLVALNNAAYALRAAASGAADDWATGQLVKLVADERLRTKPLEELHARQTVGDICRTLGEQKCQAAVPVLIDALRRHPDEADAAVALGDIGDPAAVPVLLETLEGQGAVGRTLRGEQASALHSLGKDKDLLPVLVRHVNDSRAIGLLAEIGDRSAAGPIREYLAHNPHGPERGNIYAPRREEVEVALAQLEAKDPAELTARLIKILNDDPNRDHALTVVDALRATRSSAAVEPLGRLAASTRYDMTFSSAVNALGEIGGPEAVAALVRLFDRDLSRIGDKPPDVWPSAIARALRRATGQNFGPDAAKWKAWLATNPAIRPAKGPAPAKNPAPAE
jgi:HEAT repeat protein